MYCHGTDDPMVPFSLGKASAERIQAYPWFKGTVDFKPYTGIYHGANEEELKDILAFLYNVLGYEATSKM